MLAILNVVIGSGLLLWGRRLFWLFVGAIGFMVGTEIARRITFRSEIGLVFAVLGVGLLFALGAIFLESVAIGLAGFLGGGLTVVRLLVLLGIESSLARSMAFLGGGILGVILVVWLFSWALITISSLAGASMIVGALNVRAPERILLVIGLFAAGVVIQMLPQRHGASGRWLLHHHATGLSDSTSYNLECIPVRVTAWVCLRAKPVGATPARSVRW
jgi:hypothetical protein